MRLKLVRPPQNPDTSDLTLFSGGVIDESSCTLRFFGDTLDPSAITNMLKHEASSAVRRGDRVSAGTTFRIAKQGHWILKGPTERGKSLEAQIMELLRPLPASVPLWRALTEKYESDLFCYISLEAWNRTLALSPRMLRYVSARGLEINLDIYYAGKDEDR